MGVKRIDYTRRARRRGAKDMQRLDGPVYTKHTDERIE